MSLEGMMGKRWWKDGQDPAAVAVRRALHRMRAGFRGALAGAIAAEKERLEERATAQHRIAHELAARAQSSADEATKTVAAVRVIPGRTQSSNTLRVEVALADDMLLMVDPGAALAAIAENLGRRVEQEVRTVDVAVLVERARAGRTVVRPDAARDQFGEGAGNGQADKR